MPHPLTEDEMAFARRVIRPSGGQLSEATIEAVQQITHLVAAVERNWDRDGSFEGRFKGTRREVAQAVAVVAWYQLGVEK